MNYSFSSRQDTFVKTAKKSRSFDDGYHKQANTKKFKQKAARSNKQHPQH